MASVATASSAQSMAAALAGVSSTVIAMRPAIEMYTSPVIGVPCFPMILLGLFGRLRCWCGLPAGLVAIALGMVIAWGSALLGIGIGGMSREKLGTSFADLGFPVPIPAVGHVFGGFELLGIIFVAAVPFGIDDLAEALDHAESAEAASDLHRISRVLAADGAISFVGCMIGVTHGEAVGVAVSPGVAAAHAPVAAGFSAASRVPGPAPLPAAAHGHAAAE